MDDKLVAEKKGLPISFHFQPYKPEENLFAIEKSLNDSGIKRKYLQGIASGLKLDAHSERMTKKCIDSFIEQANSGDILLYPDTHGIKASEDIGIMEKGEILDDGDWFSNFRLYDETDGIGQIKLEKITDIWKQMTGQKPYKKPRQRGFSIEGYIPDKAILSFEEDLKGNVKKRVIDDVKLDGVILVPRPAYQDSIAHAVYKALGEMSPWKRDIVQKQIKNKLSEKIDFTDMGNKYYQKKWDIQDAFESSIEELMQKNTSDKKEQLELVFDEYKNLMIEIILQSGSLFVNENENVEDENNEPYGNVSKTSRIDVYKALLMELNNYQDLLLRRS